MRTAFFGKNTWCNRKLQLCDHVKVTEIDIHDVVDKILATKPVSLKDDDYIDNLYEDIALD